MELSYGKSFNCNIKIVGKTEARPAPPAQPDPHQHGNQPAQPAQPPIRPLNTEVTIPLKYLGNFWRSLDLSLINCEVELDLKWSRNYVLIEGNDHITRVSLITTSTKLYVPVITLSINDNIKFLQNIKKHRPEITTQPKNNKLDYPIDPTFRNINGLFVL